jgi:4-hydroxybenzoate polyprenyltransferase
MASIVLALPSDCLSTDVLPAARVAAPRVPAPRLPTARLPYDLLPAGLRPVEWGRRLPERTARTLPGQVATARPGPGRLLRLCLAEARPAVLVIFMLRFLAGAALGGPRALVGHAGYAAAGAASWFFLTLAIYLYNGTCDLLEDQFNGSRRPIASGALPVDLALPAAAGAGVLGLALAMLVPGMLPLAVGLVLLGLAYSGGPVPLKRWPAACAIVVIGAGVLSYAAGDMAVNGSLNPRLAVFAVAMSAWMAVGGLAKDLSDVEGDRLAGRRTCPVVLGEGPARLITSVAALVVTSAFLVAARVFCPVLLVVSEMMLLGAGVLSIIALSRFSVGARGHQRRPYRAFAFSQFAAHLTCLWCTVL